MQLTRIQWKIENIVIKIKHLQMNKILAWNNPQGVDISLTKLIHVVPHGYKYNGLNELLTKELK